MKLFINGENVVQTKARKNICCFHADITYQSTKIPKTSTIKIEIWDHNSGFFRKADDLILETEGSIESFMETPIRPVAASVFNRRQNLVETVSFWQDELE